VCESVCEFVKSESIVRAAPYPPSHLFLLLWGFLFSCAPLRPPASPELSKHLVPSSSLLLGLPGCAPGLFFSQQPAKLLIRSSLAYIMRATSVFAAIVVPVLITAYPLGRRDVSSDVFVFRASAACIEVGGTGR
jgi:hypothetical protein